MFNPQQWQGSCIEPVWPWRQSRLIIWAPDNFGIFSGNRHGRKGRELANLPYIAMA